MITKAFDNRPWREKEALHHGKTDTQIVHTRAEKERTDCLGTANRLRRRVSTRTPGIRSKQAQPERRGGRQLKRINVLSGTTSLLVSRLARPANSEARIACMAPEKEEDVCDRCETEIDSLDPCSALFLSSPPPARRIYSTLYSSAVPRS